MCQCLTVNEKMKRKGLILTITAKDVHVTVIAGNLPIEY